MAAAAGTPATASAAFQHVVGQGESLSSVAAADGLSISQLAAANGISPDTQLVTGSSLAIPPQSASSPTLASSPVTSSPVTSSSSSTDPDGDGDIDTPQAVPAAAGSTSSGGYLVQPGDTLSAIAARNGVSLDQLAAVNGLDPSGLLLSGTTIHLSAGGSPAPATTQLVSTAPVASTGAQPTAARVSPSEVGSIASAEGVSPSLAEAIGYQESGFNNAMVSPTGATGVMQIMPGTWDYIGQNLAGPPPLSPTSPTDNIRAGSLLLHSLLNQTGGDPAMAAAGYYQGLQSVRQHGLLPDTQAYVNNVMALRQRFGGG
ncbi:MAG: LysM peptidoglycan-binding domain-containing protein [Solirubrobacteraceae bacterium]